MAWMSEHLNCFSSTELLLNFNADVNAVDENGLTPLCYAAASGNLLLVQKLVFLGANVNIPDVDIQPALTPLILAAERRYPDIVQFLLASGSELSWQVIYHFASTKNLEAINLLKHLAPECILPEFTEDSMGNSVLHWAAWNNDTSAIMLLLDCEMADIDAQNKMSETPLHVAARRGCLEAVKYLICRGANFQLVDSHQRKPLSLAVMWRRTKVAEFLDGYEKFNSMAKKSLEMHNTLCEHQSHSNSDDP